MKERTKVELFFVKCKLFAGKIVIPQKAYIL